MSSLFSDENVDPGQILKNILRIGVTTEPTAFGHDSSIVNVPASSQLDDIRMESESSMIKSQRLSTSTEEGNEKKFQIRLLGDDVNNCYPIHGNNIEIILNEVSESTQTTHLSNKVMVTSIVKYDWENRHYFGKLIAVHQNRVYVAYTVKGEKGGVVRVFNCSTAEDVLLKGFGGMVVDVDFARTSDILLGCVDRNGNLFVFKILTALNGKLTSETVIHLIKSGNPPFGLYYRLVWCPFLSDKKDENDDFESKNASMILAISCDKIVKVLNVETVRIMHGKQPLEFNKIASGLSVIDCHSSHVTDIVMVPDGSTIATACVDGFVRCFEIDLSHPLPPKCVFTWKPHNGRPVSSIFFLDDHKNITPDMQFWKFAITGADENRELKVWSCQTWTCLQTLTFSPMNTSPFDFEDIPCLQAELDMSATCMILSDIRRKILYILQISKDDDLGTVRFSQLSEFLLSQPCLSFTIQDVSTKKFHSSVNDEDLFGDESEMEDCTLLSLYAIQTKALQYLKIECKSTSRPVMNERTTTRYDSIHSKDHLTDVSNFSDTGRSASPALVINSAVSASVIGQPQTVSRSVGRDLINSSDFSPPSDISSFTYVTSFDEDRSGGDRNNFSILNRSSSNLPTQTSTSSASKELSHAIAQMSSIQPPFTTSSSSSETNDDPSRKTMSLPVDAFVNDDDLFQSASQRQSGARPKEFSPAFGIQLESEDTSHLVSLNQNSGRRSPSMDYDLMTSPVSQASSRASFHDDGQLNETVRVLSDEIQDEMSEKGEDELSIDSSDIHLRRREDETEEHVMHSRQSSLTQRSLMPLSDRSPKIQELQCQLHEMSIILKEQQKSVESLRNDLRQSEFDPSIEINNLQFKVDELQSVLVSKMADAVNHISQRNDHMLRKIAEDLDVNRQRQFEEELKNVSQAVNDCLQTQLETVVHHEMSTCIVPEVSRLFEPVSKRLNTELVQKLTATDALLKENIKQLVKSKQITETVGKEAGSILETVVRSNFRDHLIPAFERGCQNILAQVDDTFQKGLQMYIQQMQKRIDKMRQHQTEFIYDPLVHQIQNLVDVTRESNDTRQPLCKQLNDLVSIMRNYNEQLEQQKADNDSALNKIILSLPDTLRPMIRQEVSQAIQEQNDIVTQKIATTLQSRSATPAPNQSAIQMQRSQIAALVQHGQINSAFKQALSATDLNVLMFLCEMVNPTDVFDKSPCPLEQTVLLSLIQQLSADLRTNSQLKYKFLEDALLNIELKSPLIKEHLPLILSQLCQNVDAVINSSDLDPIQKRPIRMLHLTAHSLLQTVSQTDRKF